jgi:hypothetical protein
MAEQGTSFRHARSIGGAILGGVGIFILYQNIAGVVMWWRYILASSGSEVLGKPLAAILILLQACATNDRGFVLGILQQMLVASWPLLLVMVGAVLSREDFTDDV